MSFSLLVLALVGVGGFLLLLAVRGPAGSWVRLLVEALAAHTVVATLAAVALVSFDAFRPATALALASAVPLVALSRRRIGQALARPMATPRELLILPVLILTAPMVLPRLQPLRMDHDAGVYSNRAIHHLRQGGLVGEIPARSRLEGDLLATFDRDNMAWATPPGEATRGLADSYLPGTYVTASDPGSFRFQFFPGWPMVMALWAGIFGLPLMFHVQVFLYVLNVALFSLLLERLTVGWAAHATSLVLFASSPLVVFFSKYTTSETFLVFVLLLVLHVFGRGPRLYTLLAGAGVLLLVVSHSSTFLYAPLLLLPLLQACRSPDREQALPAALAFGSLLAGLPLGLFFSPFYLRDVYAISFRFLPVSDPAAAGLAAVGTFYAAGLGLSLALLTRASPLPARLPALAAGGERLLPRVVAPALLLMAAWTAYRGYQLGWTDRFAEGAGAWALRSTYAGQGWAAVAHLDLVSMVMATSLVGLPTVLVLAVRRGREVCASGARIFLLGAVLWTLVVYTFFRVDTPFNYYASRYYLPVLVPSTLLLLGGLLGELRLAPRAVALVLVVGLAFNLHFDRAFVRAPVDDDKLRFVGEVAAKVGNGRFLFVRAEQETQRVLALPLQSLHDITVVRVAHLRGEPEETLVEKYLAALGLRGAAVLSTVDPGPSRGPVPLRMVDREFAQRGVLYPTEVFPRERRYFLYEVDFSGGGAAPPRLGPGDRHQVQ